MSPASLRSGLLWQYVCIVLALVTSAAGQLFATNSTDALDLRFGGRPRLTPEGSPGNVSSLVPVTRSSVLERTTPALSGDLVYINASRLSLLDSQDISYISCNPLDYPQDGDDATALLRKVLGEHNVTAVVLYSTETDYCGYENRPEPLEAIPIFSMTDRSESAALREVLQGLPLAYNYFVRIERTRRSREQGSDGGDGGGNPLGPSPSTAVAMIILYSITGIITALFLVIIITGAVRAHRHPDRYGPRDVLGRPRQSRARGIGRAILDTIPIVKFGERNEMTKTTDVEMQAASPPEATNGNSTVTNGEADAATGTQDREDETRPEQPRTAEHVQSQPEPAPAAATEDQYGIAPAETAPTGAADSRSRSTAEEEHQGCSICTEDFERGQDIRLLPCDHKFHPECVDPWLLNVSGTCPLCRVDLRPTSRRSSVTSNPHDQHQNDNGELPPPLGQADPDVSRHRRSALRDILMFRSQPNASPEERISALRRLRESRREGGDGEGDDGAGGSAGARRSRRISARLSGVFGARSRRSGVQSQGQVQTQGMGQEEVSSGALPVDSQVQRQAEAPAQAGPQTHPPAEPQAELQPPTEPQPQAQTEPLAEPRAEDAPANANGGSQGNGDAAGTDRNVEATQPR